MTFLPFPIAFLQVPLPVFNRSASRGHEQAPVPLDPTMAKDVLCDLPVSDPDGSTPHAHPYLWT